MIQHITLNTSHGAVEEAPKQWEIIFLLGDGKSPSTLSLWLSSDMTLKEFMRTMLEFVSKLIYR